MSNYLPNLISGSLDLILAGFFIAFFFIPKFPKLYKKTWLVLAACGFLILGGIDIYQGVKNFLDHKISAQEETGTSISETGNIHS